MTCTFHRANLRCMSWVVNELPSQQHATKLCFAASFGDSRPYCVISVGRLAAPACASAPTDLRVGI